MVLALKEFAPVKDVRLVADSFADRELPICYVEFASLEHSKHTFETIRAAVGMATGRSSSGGASGLTGNNSIRGGLLISGAPVTLAYAAAATPPASAAPAIAAATAAMGVGSADSGRRLCVSSSAETALRAFQSRQNAAKIAALESAEISEASAAAASEAQERADARQRARAEARVDTGAGAGTGSLALAFAQAGPGGTSGVDARGGAVNGSNGSAAQGSGAGGVADEGAGGAQGSGAGGAGGSGGSGAGAGAGASGGATQDVVAAALEKRMNPPEWPPSFQEAGAAYLFDKGSG